MYWQVACFGGVRLGSPLSGFARVNFAGKRGQVLSDWLAFGIATVTFGVNGPRGVGIGSVLLSKTVVSGRGETGHKRSV